MITFPDGRVIHDYIVTNTFCETIKAIGAEKVRSLNMQMQGYPLVSEEQYKGKSTNWASVGSGLFVNARSTTSWKFKQLRQINDRLKLGLKVELLEP